MALILILGTARSMKRFPISLVGRRMRPFIEQISECDGNRSVPEFPATKPRGDATYSRMGEKLAAEIIANARRMFGPANSLTPAARKPDPKLPPLAALDASPTTPCIRAPSRRVAFPTRPYDLQHRRMPWRFQRLCARPWQSRHCVACHRQARLNRV